MNLRGMLQNHDQAGEVHSNFANSVARNSSTSWFFSCVMSCVLSTSGRPYNIHADDATDSQTSYRQWLMMSTHSIGFVRSVDVGFSFSSHRAFSPGRASNARHNLYREWLNIDGFTEILSSYMLKIFGQKHSGRSSNVYKSQNLLEKRAGRSDQELKIMEKS